MPWETKTVMKQREEFVEAAEANSVSFSALCREYGISRKTGYKWLKRAQMGQQLLDKSRCPHRQPSKTAEETESLIVAVREANPAWGGRVIKSVLEAAGCKGIPSEKTCTNILRRNGLIDPEEAKKHTPCQRFERKKCNQLWQIDFKGDFLLHDGTRCYPFDILDDHSRYCIRIDPKSSTHGVKESVLQAFLEYGLPNAILSDNGAQFSGFRGGYTQFERFLMDLDVFPIHGRIMHPQTQGKIERFHRTMKQEALRNTPENLEQAKVLLEQWRWKYNEIRPHSALGLKTPGSIYQPSERKYAEPKPYLYPENAKMIKINNWGYLRFGPIEVYLSETLKDTMLEIRPSEGDTFAVIYRNYQIALVDAAEKKLVNRRIRRL